MERTLIAELKNSKNKKVRIKGWLNTLRLLGKVSFAVLRDRTGFVQIVIQEKKLIKDIKNLQPGSVFEVEGEISKTDQTDLGVEIVNPQIKILSKVETPLPVDYTKEKINADIDTILDYRTITLRNRQLQSIFRIQGEIAHAYRMYMHEVVGAYEYFGPNIIGASSEGGAEFFNVDYFGYTATLAQSSQLYKQIMVGVNERAFAILPSFRAENSNTVRHLTEFHQLEFEMGFFDTWHEIMDVEEGAIKYIVNHVKNSCKSDLEILGTESITVPKDKKFPRITFKEAQEIYFDRAGVDEREEDDLSPSAEKELCKYALEKFGTECIFITDWKTSKRPFYSYTKEDNPELTNTFDLLCAGTEITSGGQRHHTHSGMIQGIKSKDMDPADFTDYLQIFEFGMPPHGGFGIGLERLTTLILNLQNIRQASLFPSDPRRIASNRLRANIFFGGENIKNEIIRILKDKKIKFKHMTHEETPTSQDASRVRKTTPEEGVKAIILKGKNTKKNYQVCVPSNFQINIKAVEKLVDEKCEFEKPETIKKRYGLIIGGVPPFGNLLGIKTYYDKKILDQKRSAFNCGLRTDSIIMPSQDLFDIANAEIGEFTR